jgi:hypothetical protein
MTAAALVTATAAALIFGFGPGFALALWVAARRDSKRTPAPVVGLSTAEWDELTALQDRARAEFESSPIYDRLVCEAIEKAEGWV